MIDLITYSQAQRVETPEMNEVTLALLADIANGGGAYF